MSGLTLDPDQHWMQFRILRNMNGPQDKTGWVRPAPLAFRPSQNIRLPGCSCSQFFEVMKLDDPAWEAQREGLAPGLFLYICRCYGEFAE
jgi:hypothetical protein